MVGKDEVLVQVLLAILAGGHILLEDIPGVGKTTMALNRATSIRSLIHIWFSRLCGKMQAMLLACKCP